MMSVTMKQVHDLAQDYDAKLRADDSRFRRAVVVLHEEGTVYHFRSAFMMTYGEYLMVFTEHQSYHVFALDELSGWWQYKDVKVGKYVGE